MNVINFIKNLMILCVGVLVFSCSNSEEPNETFKDPGPRHSIDISTRSEAILHQGNEFAYQIWPEVCKLSEEESGNTVFSPLSLQFALSMLANGAEGETLNEILSVYTKGTDEEGVQNLRELSNILLNELPNVDKSAVVGIANSIWCDINYSFNTSFEQICADYFNASSHKFDLYSEHARDEINSWCEENTRGLISEFLSTAPMAEAMLLNATYFKGQWKFPFEKKNTHKKTFYCESGNTKTVDMMSLDNYRLNGVETDKLLYVTIPYGNGGFEMEVMMPKEGQDFNECVAAMKENRIMEDAKMCGRVNIQMPKFDVSTNLNLLDVLLQSMPHISDKIKNIIQERTFTVGVIFQTSKCLTDEEGTEAAAVTEIGLFGATGEFVTNNFDVTLDHPFFFTIKETSTNAILFMGKIAEF